MSFLFLTGIENRYPTIASGKRIDQMDRCGHYARWEADFALAKELGVDALRYGPAYYRTHVAPDRVEWESCDEPMLRLRDLGIEVIAELCHSGVPTWLDGVLDPAFPVLFAQYARAFARRYPWVRYFTPVSDMLTCATNSALLGWWNDCLTSDGAFVRAVRNLCMAHELAVEAIVSEHPDAVIVQGERIARFVPLGARSRHAADRLNAFRFLPLDLTCGRELAPGMAPLLNAHGVTSNDLSFFREPRAVGRRWLGLDYFPDSEQRVALTGRRTVLRDRLGFRALVTEYHRRYRLPIVYRGTHDAGPRAARWLDEQWRALLAARAAGVPIVGFGWGSLTDQVDGEHALRVERNEPYRVGLVGLDRRPRPVRDAFGSLIARWRATHEHGDERAGSTRDSDLAANG